MANTLTNLTPDLYAALDTVSRELVGLIPAVTMDASAERAAVGQTVRSPVAPASTAADIVAATNAPDTGDQTIANKTITISKARAVPVRSNGEEQRGLNTGPGYNSILQSQFAQAIRTLCNEVETDLSALYTGFSRATGTSGTTPFGTAGDFTDASNSLQILKDNGAPLSDNQLVVNTAAGAKLLGLQSRVDIQGNDSMLRQGVLLATAGMDIRESAQIITGANGTEDGAYLTDGIQALGATTIAVDTGTGTILAGDTVSFAGVADKYVVTTTYAGGDGSVTIAEPGLREAVAAGAAITVSAPAANNMAFNRGAIALVTRAPARPSEGDSADDVMLMTDPRSGLTFEVSLYKEYRRVHYEIGLAWGVSLIKPEHTAILLG